MNRFHETSKTITQTVVETEVLIARIIKRELNEADPFGIASVITVQCPFAVPAYSHLHSHGLSTGAFAGEFRSAPCVGQEYLLKEW